MVPQDCVLFHDTIRHNIQYGRLESGQEEVERAAEIAELHHTIMEWPTGYQTQVGERGLKLSGGEKQRVAIARYSRNCYRKTLTLLCRAVLKNTSILIFDEATSSLDSITEKSIMTALKAATEGRTSIIIAHRLSTVVHCDKILVIREGRVVEEGTHTDLLALPGSYYSQLWESQHSLTSNTTINTTKKEEIHHHHHDHGDCGGCGHAHH